MSAEYLPKGAHRLCRAGSVWPRSACDPLPPRLHRRRRLEPQLCIADFDTFSIKKNGTAVQTPLHCRRAVLSKRRRPTLERFLYLSICETRVTHSCPLRRLSCAHALFNGGSRRLELSLPLRHIIYIVSLRPGDHGRRLLQLAVSAGQLSGPRSGSIRSSEGVL